MDSFDLNVVKYTFGLIIQPLPSHLQSFNSTKKLVELNEFFIAALEFFKHCANRCDKNDKDSIFTCLQMSIDAHKLRLVAFPENVEFFNETLAYISSIAVLYPDNGMLWFQKCIIEYTLRPKKISSFTQLETFIRW
jgi:hypothetical protein